MKKTETKTRLCPACEADGHEVIQVYTQAQWPIVRCSDCGFVYLRLVPDDTAFADDFAWEKTSAAETKRRKTNWLYRLDHATRFRLKVGNLLDRRFVENAVASGGNVLDIGCGGSCRIADGLVPYGIEISEGLAAHAAPIYASRGGYVVNAPAAEGLDRFEDDFFDHAILRSYLEHESTPRQVLEKLFRKLKPGGTAALKVPDYGCVNRYLMGAKWCGFRFPDHQNYFTRASLGSMVERIGYRIKFENLLPGMNDNIYAALIRPGR
jgi:SAM-dependent methyltransferase